jgi:hypothetical protein
MIGQPGGLADAYSIHVTPDESLHPSCDVRLKTFAVA